MKKIIVIAIAFIGLQGIAQGQKKQGNKNGNNHREMMMNLSAEEIATLQTKKMTLFLDLNETQQAQIKSINLENATKRKTMMAERKAKKESETTNKPNPEKYYARANAKLDHKIAMKAKMKNILNTEQYARWEKAQMRMAKKGKHRNQVSNKNMQRKI